MPTVSKRAKPVARDCNAASMVLAEPTLGKRECTVAVDTGTNPGEQCG
jgi:hypothetical protein